MEQTKMARISPELHERMRLDSVKRGITVGQLIEEAVTEFERGGKAQDREKLALARAVDGLGEPKRALLRRFLAVLKDTPDDAVMLRGFEKMLNAWADMLRRYPA